MDLSQAARFLKVSEATLRRWVRQGLMRGSGPAGEEFDRAVLERWARAHHVRVGAAPASPRPAERLFSSAIRRGSVAGRPRVDDAFDAIRVAIGGLSGIADEAVAGLLKQVLERERMASTGLGQGVALPHPRTPPAVLITDPLVSVLYLEEPIDWAALDGLPVHTVLLLLSPSAPVHLQLLSRIAQTLRAPGFLELLRERPDQDALVERARAVEESLQQ